MAILQLLLMQQLMPDGDTGSMYTDRYHIAPLKVLCLLSNGGFKYYRRKQKLCTKHNRLMYINIELIRTTVMELKDDFRDTYFYW